MDRLYHFIINLLLISKKVLKIKQYLMQLPLLTNFYCLKHSVEKLKRV